MLQVVDVIPEHVKSVADVKDQIISKLKNEKAMAVAKEKCQAAWSKVSSGSTLAAVAAEEGLTAKTTDSFTMSGYVQDVGREPRFVGAAFSLNPGTSR